MNKQLIVEELQQEEKKLNSIIRKAQKRLQKAPEGSVRIVKHGKGYQFYLRKKPTDTSGKYMPASERKKAIALVQKKYDQRIVQAAEKQVRVIQRFLQGYEPDALKSAYTILSKIRREKVSPVELSDEEYIKEWQSFEYTKKGFAEDIPEHYTSKGERVRSKSEVMIADALGQAGVPYRYEFPVEITGITFHPDFTILRISDRKQIYWEHLGMMDDPEYCNNAVQKIRTYEMNRIYPGINLILTAETSRIPVNNAVIQSMVKNFCL